MNRERGVLERRAREMVLNINDYFEKEKNNCKDLLKTLTQFLQIAQTDGESEVRVPVNLLSCAVGHLQNTCRVTERVVAATLVNKNTVSRIRSEGEEAKNNKTKIQTPVRKPRGKKDFFSNVELKELKSIIRANFIENKQDFKLNTLLAIARRDLKYKGSKTTLRRIVPGLGFQLVKDPHKALLALSEDPNVQHPDYTENKDNNLIKANCTHNEQLVPCLIKVEANDNLEEEYLESVHNTASDDELLELEQ